MADKVAYEVEFWNRETRRSRHVRVELEGVLHGYPEIGKAVGVEEELVLYYERLPSMVSRLCRG